MERGFYREIVKESTDVATVIDANGKITYVSPSVRRMLGYDPDELVGAVGFEYQHPDDREAVADAIERLRADPDGTETIETRFRRADGSWCWIEATMQNRFDDEAINGILVNSRDISERKQREQSYRELAEEYHTLLNNAEDAIFFISVESDEGEDVFRFERLSPSYEEQTGITTEAIRGETPQAVFGPELGAELEANYRRCVDAGEPITYQEEVPVETGAQFWQTNLAPVVTNGEVTRIVGITRDVTDRVRRERQLRSQKEQLDEFASVVSHDLRNPLGVAQGRTALLAEEYESEHIDPIVTALDRIEEIVSDTLTLARQGQVVRETRPVGLTDLLGKCWNTVSTAEATIEIVDELTLHADRGRLEHVFENLFRNAVQHSTTTSGSQDDRDSAEPKGESDTRSESPIDRNGTGLTVRVGSIDEHGFYVEDTGPGIPKESRSAVFEPGHTAASDGTGFGLTIVRRIAEAHGWDVTVTSGAEGGARFEFTGVEIEPT